MIEKLRNAREFFEDVDICDKIRTFCIRESATDEGYTDIELSLTTVLGKDNIGEGYEYAKELFGVFYCTDTRASCDISEVGTIYEFGLGVELYIFQSQITTEKHIRYHKIIPI